MIKIKMINPEQQFINDFETRFGGCAMVDDFSVVPFSVQNRTCCKREVMTWIDQWISENCDLNNGFKLKVNTFLKLQFKKV